jgi:hypothetical protein
MTKEVRKQVSPPPENVVAVPRRSAVLAALSFLSASMGLSLNDVAKGEEKGIQQDVTVNKARTQDKTYNKWNDYIRGQVKPGGSTGPNRPPLPTTGSKNQK